MLAVLPIIWILFGVAAALAAAHRGRSSCGWFALGVLLGPFGLIFALLSKPIPVASPPAPKTPPLPSLDDETKKCPQCAELIKLEALKCRFCGFELDPDQVRREVASRRTLLQERLDKIAAGKMECPFCGQWDAHNAYLPDGSWGPWCPHCRRPATQP